VATDTSKYLNEGRYDRAFESAAPLAIRPALKSYRELTEGVTTKQGTPMKLDGKQIQGAKSDFVLSLLGSISGAETGIKKDVFYSYQKRHDEIAKEATLIKKRAAVDLERYKTFKDIPKEIKDKYKADLNNYNRKASEYNKTRRIKEKLDNTLGLYDLYKYYKTNRK